MKTFNNNVYICNLDKEISRYNKQFRHTIIPCNFNLSVPLNPPAPSKYDGNIYKRCDVDATVPRPISLNCNGEPTKCSWFNDNVNTETELHNTHIRNNHCTYNSYIPSKESDLYKLNIPYEKQSGKHDLLFNIPNFSSSCTVPYTESNPFNNFTREDRNKFK